MGSPGTAISTAIRLESRSFARSARERLGDQLRRLWFVITSDIKEGAAEGKEDPRDTEASTGTELPEWARRDSNARPLAPEASALSN
jgi:hypothetical protein